MNAIRNLKCALRSCVRPLWIEARSEIPAAGELFVCKVVREPIGGEIANFGHHGSLTISTGRQPGPVNRGRGGPCGSSQVVAEVL